MTHVDLWRACREILWQKAQGIITPELAIEQIEQVTAEYQGEAIQTELELTGRAA